MDFIYENNSDRFMFHTFHDFTFPAHLHSGFELILVEKGEINVTIGNHSKLLSKGELGIAFPNQIHSYETDQDCGHSKGILLLCPSEICGDFLSTLLINHPRNPFLQKEQVHTDIKYILNSLLKLDPPAQDTLPLIRAYIQLILAHLLPSIELIKNRDTQTPSLTKRLITLISEQYTEPVSLEKLSKQLGISRYSISRIFSEKLHTTFSLYLNTLRIDYAKHLLKGSSNDILTISLMCGYESTRTFNREFKSLCGCQPREYRKG
ncbi:MAG: DNA-binding protein AraC-type [Anaerocolumna sp.]|nr:DNA-binding protein AraC-type [Anaerocolumna sp.]